MSSSRDSLEALHDHAAFVRAVAHRLVGDPSEVDDLVQETWVRVLTGRRSRIGSLRAWLAAIVRSIAIDRHRAEAARKAREIEIVRRQQEARAAASVDDAFGFDALTSALQALPADYRRVLQLRFHAQLPPSAIASELGVPIATVKSRLQRALNLLRDDLTARHGGDGRWRSALALALRPETAALNGSGLAVAAGAIMSKTWIAVTAVIVAVALWMPLHWSDFGAPDPANAPAVDAAAASPVRATAAPASSAGANDATPPPLRREAAAANVVATAPPAPVRGRIVYRSTGQGVPFLTVQLRADGRSVALRTDRDGKFASQDAWPEHVEIAVPGAPRRAATETEETAASTTAPTFRIATGPIVMTGPQHLAFTSAGSATAANAEPAPPTFQPLASTAARGADGWLIVVELGPTYLLQPEPSEPLAGIPLRAALRDDDDALATRHEVPHMAFGPIEWASAPDAVWWCRLPSPPEHYGERCRLEVVATDGFWRGELPAVPSAGVIGPLGITLQQQGQVRGTVRNVFGSPVAGAHVVVTIGEGLHALRFAANSDANGHYRLTRVQTGEGHAQVVGENLEPNAKTVQVRAGLVTECDLVLSQRPIGGQLAGTITTASGREFRAISVHLTSRQDRTIWRTAEIVWKEVEGRLVAEFVFADVPLLECDLQLNTFAPCRVPVQRLQATPPATNLHFHVDDVVADRRVAVAITSENGAKVEDWTLRLVGDDGWALSVRARDLTDGQAALPRLPGVWRLQGPGMRCQQGRIEAIGDRLELRTRAGWSALVSGMDIANFFPARGAEVFVDGMLVGALDDDGQLWLDLPAVPTTISFDPNHWRIYRDAAHRSDLDAQGALQPDASSPDLIAAYLQRVP